MAASQRLPPHARLLTLVFSSSPSARRASTTWPTRETWGGIVSSSVSERGFSVSSRRAQGENAVTVFGEMRHRSARLAGAATFLDFSLHSSVVGCEMVLPCWALPELHSW